MKIGILSDIHGNGFALEVVCAELKKLDIQTIIVAGDTVGYYYDIEKVLCLLSKFQTFMIKGNHEEMLKQIINREVDQSKIRDKYGSSLFKAIQVLNKTVIDDLINLEHPKTVEIDSIKILVSHGSPWDMNVYLYSNSDESLWNKFLTYSEAIFILGQTHHQIMKRHKDKIIINPGSVGQNRNRAGYADWAVFDTDSRSTTFHSTPYILDELIKQCLEHDPGSSILTRMLQR